MAKITKLTAEQEAKLPEYRDRWLAIGLSCDPINRADARVAIGALYGHAGLEAPDVVVFLRSPLEGATAAAMMDQVRAQVGDQVRDQVWAQVRAQVWAQVGAQVWDQVWEVGAQVWDQVWAQVGAQVGDQVWDQVGDQVFNACYAGHEAGWLGFYDFFRQEFGLAQKIGGLAAIGTSCGWVWPFEKLAIITDRPEQIRFDGAHLLHCETGPAIRYRDGFSVYAWHGRRVPAAWIERRSEIDPAEIIGHENVEMRAVGAEIVGWPRMLSALKCKVIDQGSTADIGDLIELTLPGLGQAGRFLRAACPRNGLIVEGVPRESDIDRKPINTALAAQAWRVGLSQADYHHPTHRT